MLTKETHEAMQVARSFFYCNETAKQANRAITDLLSATPTGFLTKEQFLQIRETATLINELREKTNEWNAAIYLDNLQPKKDETN